MDLQIRTGDVIVCRVNGTSEFYVIGTVQSGRVGDFSLHSVSTIVGRCPALARGYDDRTGDHRVWLFDGAAAGYVRTTGSDE